MNFIAKRLNLIGIGLLLAFTTAAAGLYFGVPVVSPKKRLATPGEGKYVCPMHPEVTSAHPDKCSECLMALVPASAMPLAHSGCGMKENHGCCAKKETSGVTLPPGHPPIGQVDNHSGCGPGARPADAESGSKRL
jgi:hypothetical protein